MTPTKPSRSRPCRQLIPVVVLTSVTALVTGSFALADGAPAPTIGGVAAAYIPVDGYVNWSVQTGGDTDIRRVTEHSLSTGVAQLLALPPLQQTSTLDSIDNDARTTHFWRETTRALDGEETRQLIDLYTLTDAGVSLVASYGADYAWVYDPPIVQLPKDIAPGTTWESSGDAMQFGLIRYEHSAKAIVPHEAQFLAAAQRTGVDIAECIQVDTNLHLADDTGAALGDFTQKELWCTGKGRLATTVTLDETMNRYDPTPPAPDLHGVSTDPQRSTWSALERWTVREAPLLHADKFYGEGAVTVSVADTPRTTAAGLIIVADVNTNDLLAFRLNGDALYRQWIAHPGGAIVTYGTTGDVTLVSTSLRQLVAYDGNGVRLWQADVPELVVAPPSATGDGRFLTVGLDGTVTLRDALTGEPAWSHKLGADVEIPAVVTGDTLTVVDRAGTITTVGLARGEVLWSRPGTPTGAMISVGSVIVTADDDGWVRLFQADNGDPSHSWRFQGATRALLKTGDAIMFASDEVTLGLAPSTGTELWRGVGVDAAVGDGDRAVAFRGASATAIDARGETVAAWQVPESFAWLAQHAVAIRDGILLMHSGNDATVLGAR